MKRRRRWPRSSRVRRSVTSSRASLPAGPRATGRATRGCRALPITRSSTLSEAVRVTSDLPFGATDCALPMLDALEQGIEADAFIVLTDNETWAGDVHPSQALRRYRRKTGIPAKLVVAAMTATECSIADPEDAGMLDVVGFGHRRAERDARLPRPRRGVTSPSRAATHVWSGLCAEPKREGYLLQMDPLRRPSFSALRRPRRRAAGVRPTASRSRSVRKQGSCAEPKRKGYLLETDYSPFRAPRSAHSVDPASRGAVGQRSRHASQGHPADAAPPRRSAGGARRPPATLGTRLPAAGLTSPKPGRRCGSSGKMMCHPSTTAASHATQ